MNGEKWARESIEGFSLDVESYGLCGDEVIVKNGENSQVYTKGKCKNVRVAIDFRGSVGSSVFVGANLKGRVDINVYGDNAILYIGDNCRLNGVTIKSKQDNDFVAIGNYVTARNNNVWMSGSRSDTGAAALVIGDDCMFSSDVVIRNSDSHPIFLVETGEHVNSPVGDVHIEPHVWVGEKVSLLKAVKVGACSIVGLGSIVTKDMPRFSAVSGVPAKPVNKERVFWARNDTERARTRARYYVDRYG